MVDKEEALAANRKAQGKIQVFSKVRVSSRSELSTYYTPGIAYVSEEIKKDVAKVYEYTSKPNLIAIVSDGTRILGLGDIGPEAGLPVMEGKAILFKRFGGVDAVPLCISTKDEEEIVKFVKQIRPTFGAVNIEDIESPKCFSIVDRLSAELDIPIFHDDQYGTAIVVLAALINASKLAGKKLQSLKVVMNGAGAAGVGISKLLHHAGIKDVIVVDTNGIIYHGRQEHMNKLKEELAQISNPEGMRGSLSDAVKGADVLIGASKAGAFTSEMIKSMADKPIVFALANPVPEIDYAAAKAAGAFVAATGRSDTPNQVNNLLAFPAVMRGLLEARAKRVTQDMLISAAKAMAKVIGSKLDAEHILPDILDKRYAIKLATTVAAAVAEAAVSSGDARVNVDAEDVKRRTKESLVAYARMEKRFAI